MNLQQTDCCVAWLISPLPTTKNTESRDEQDPVATDGVKYADVELEMSWGVRRSCTALLCSCLSPGHKHGSAGTSSQGVDPV